MSGTPLELTSYYKLHVKDLQQCKESEGNRNWTLEIENARLLEVKLVWLQGEICEVQDDCLLLRDSTGSCRVMASNAVQSSNSWLSPGVYCSVMGQLQQAGVEPQVAAMKMNDISGHPVLRDMWPLEVAELRQVLSGKVLPSLL